MDFLASPAALQASGTLLSASSQLAQARASGAAGEAIRKAKEFEAGQMTVRAGQARAVSQREAAEARRKGRFIQSALQARAAASGAGATDPTVAKLAGDIAAEAELRSLTALFGGEEQARLLESGAAVRRFEGEQAVRAGKIARRAGFMKAGATLLGGFGRGSLFEKFGERINPYDVD